MSVCCVCVCVCIEMVILQGDRYIKLIIVFLLVDDPDPATAVRCHYQYNLLIQIRFFLLFLACHFFLPPPNASFILQDIIIKDMINRVIVL